MLSELYQYGITPDMLEAKIPETTSPMLRQKLEDISVIYKAFQEYIRDRYITTEEILDVLCRHLPESKLIRDSVITWTAIPASHRSSTACWIFSPLQQAGGGDRDRRSSRAGAGKKRSAGFILHEL